MRKNKCGLFFTSIICLFLFTFFCADIAAARQQKQDTNMYKQLELFADAITIIQSSYVEEASAKDLIYGALKGMLSSLDMHSQFLTPDEYDQIKIETEGEFGGLGIVITIRNKVLTVVSPLESTPAHEAGIEAGDIIVEIDGETTKDIVLTEAVKKLRGDPGTKVKLTILREEEDEFLKFEITRDIIEIKSIREARILEDNIGYLKLIDFQEDTANKLDREIKKLKEKGMEALILDLRNNPGGLLNVAVDVTERFIPKDKLIVYTTGRKENQSLRFVSKAGKKYIEYPLVILVNHGSASGSEIVAGAIQDHNRGIILGTTTFGKGSVQTVIPMPDNSALRLTTSKYFTPEGRSIQGTGIAPDIIVKYERKDKKEDQDLFDRIEKKENDQDSFEYDSQILRALDLLKALRIYEKYLHMEIE